MPGIRPVRPFVVRVRLPARRHAPAEVSRRPVCHPLQPTELYVRLRRADRGGDGRAARHLGQDVTGARAPDQGGREGPAQLFSRTLCADDRRPDPTATTDPALPVHLHPSAPAARENAGDAVRRSLAGPYGSLALLAAGRLAAVLADQRDQVARPGNLDQDRSLGQRPTHQLEHLVRQPSRPRGRIAGQSAVGVDSRPHPGRGVPGLGPVGGQLLQPSPLHPLLGLAAAGEAGRQHRAALLGRPQGQHRSGVRVRRPLFGEQVAAHHAAVRHVTAEELVSAMAVMLWAREAKRVAVPADLPRGWLAGLEGVRPLADDPPLDPASLSETDGVVTEGQ